MTTSDVAPDDDFVAVSLQHGNLQVDDEPTPRPMLAVLDARPGRVEQFRAAIITLVREVRREPGCLEFTAFEARDVPGRFYLYEIYENSAAFTAHLQTEHVHTFIGCIPKLSTGGPGSLIQLDEVAID